MKEEAGLYLEALFLIQKVFYLLQKGYIYINTHRHTPLYSQAPFTNKKA